MRLHACLTPATAQLRGSQSVTLQTEGAHVGEIALSTALDNWNEVIGIPQMTAVAPILFELPAGIVIEFALVAADGLGVEAALRADAVVAGEDLLTQIAGVGAQLPLVDTGSPQKVKRPLGTATPHQRHNPFWRCATQPPGFVRRVLTSPQTRNS